MAVTAKRKQARQWYYSRRWPRTDDAQARIWNQQTCGSNHTGPGLTGCARQQDPIGQAGNGCEIEKSKCVCEARPGGLEGARRGEERREARIGDGGLGVGYSG